MSLKLKDLVKESNRLTLVIDSLERSLEAIRVLIDEHHVVENQSYHLKSTLTEETPKLAKIGEVE